MNLVAVPFLRIRSYTVLVAVGWTLLILVLFGVDLIQQRKTVLDIARAEAFASIDKDLVYRRWNASHGGVYVPVTETTQPNPYLNVPEREITTPSGKLLTRINPAYMTRQVYEMGNEQYGFLAHLSSLKPINPKNTPDAWERQALQSFENGMPQASSEEVIDGQKYMRVMVPLVTEAGCLKCHAQQGYKVGDVRGGLSVAVPMSRYAPIESRWTLSHSMGYGSLWLIGLIGIFIMSKDLKKRILERQSDLLELEESHRELRSSEQKYRLLFEQMMDGFALHEVICDRQGHPVDYRFLAVNPVFETFTGLDAKDIVGKTALEVMPTTEKVWIERYGKVALGGPPDHFEEFSAALNRYYEVRAFSPEPNKFAVIFHDITQRKYSENITLAHMKFIEIATTQSLDDLMQAALDEAEVLTGSCIGFFHFMDADQETLTLQNWSTRTVKEFCKAEGKGMHYPVGQAGVWVDCVYTKMPVIHNDYASLPNRKGLPEGHAAVKRELVVPVLRGGMIIALLGVGNKETDYTQKDVEIVQQLADVAMEIVERKRAELAREKARQDYKSLVQTIDGIVWESDADTLEFSFVSVQAERILGYPVERWLTEPDFWASHIHEDDRKWAVSFCRAQTQSKRSHEFEYRIIAADGRVVWLRDVVTVIVENDKPVKLRGIMIDITNNKYAEKALREKNNELEVLFTLSSHLRAASTPEEMLPLVLKEMARILNADANAVLLLCPDRTQFEFSLGEGLLAQNTGMIFPSEQSISGYVTQTQQPYFTLDFAGDPRRSPVVIGSERIGPAMIVPLRSEMEVLGTLLSARGKDSPPGPFGPSELKLLTAIGEMVGNALRRSRLYDQALSRLQRVQALRSIDLAIAASMDADVTLKLLLSQTLTLMNFAAADILVYDPHSLTLKHAASQGFRSKAIERRQVRLSEGIAGRAALERQTISIPDLAINKEYPRDPVLSEESFHFCCAVPMIAKGKMRGVLEVYNRDERVSSDEWIEFLEALAMQAAIALDNSQLFNDLQHSNYELTMAYDATIEGWSRAMDLRDAETAGHTRRVLNRTIDLARAAGIPEDQIIHVRRGVLLHDIGKMGIPDHILLKPGRLTEDETVIMHRHPQFARDMLHPIEFLRPAIDIPYCHHEKWDGTGYPRGLRGEQIPVAARVFAVVDVWDALTSKRSYRLAWTFSDALAYIREQSGKHFDPQVVEFFMQELERNGWGNLSA
jgi:PAS domain S-box-containing protein